MKVNYAVASGAERNFRAVTFACDALEAQDTIGLPADLLEALAVAEGDSVICVRI
ncbi:hypothetical protein D3C72_1534870 [compost metagenome]